MASPPQHSKTRSRGGCANCKRRKRKCDQTRPACFECRRRKVACEGYRVELQWDWGVASRGLLARAKQPVQAGGGRGEPVKPVADVWDFRGAECQKLFAEFLNSGLHALYSTSTGSWIKGMMADLSMESAAMLGACVALQLLQSPRDRTGRFHLCFEKALKVFGDELLLGGSSIRRGTLCAGLLLCTISVGASDVYEKNAHGQISQGIPWTNHIQCMVDLYGLGDTIPSSYVADPYIGHLLEVMGVMDLSRMVLGRQTPSLGIWTRTRQAQARLGCRTGDDRGIEVTSGMPHTLLDILARADDDCTVERDLWQWQSCEGEFLQALFWNSWRFAAILLVRRSACACGTSHTTCRRWAPESRHLLWQLVATLESLRLGVTQEENKHLLVANGMLFPYMVACSETALLREHPAWLAALKRTLDTDVNPIWTYHFEATRKIFSDVWRRHDENVAPQEETCDMDKACRALGIELALF